jgi:hypothetical protein
MCPVATKAEDAAGAFETPILGVQQQVDLAHHGVNGLRRPPHEALPYEAEIFDRDLELCFERSSDHDESLPRSSGDSKLETSYDRQHGWSERRPNRVP